MEPEVVCINSYGRKGAFGVLESDTSNLITLPLEVIHVLLSKNCPLLTTLGRKLQYEVAIGQNGKVDAISPSRNGKESFNLIDSHPKYVIASTSVRFPAEDHSREVSKKLYELSH